MQRFQDDLLESVRQMRTGKAARVTQVKLSAAAEARAHCGLSQHEFAALLGVSPRTLQDWEKGRRADLLQHMNQFASAAECTIH